MTLVEYVVIYESQGGISDSRLPTSDFRLPTSDIKWLISNVRPTSQEIGPDPSLCIVTPPQAALK